MQDTKLMHAVEALQLSREYARRQIPELIRNHALAEHTCLYWNSSIPAEYLQLLEDYGYKIEPMFHTDSYGTSQYFRISWEEK